MYVCNSFPGFKSNVNIIVTSEKIEKKNKQINLTHNFTTLESHH